MSSLHLSLRHLQLNLAAVVPVRLPADSGVPVVQRRASSSTTHEPVTEALSARGHFALVDRHAGGASRWGENGAADGVDAVGSQTYTPDLADFFVLRFSLQLSDVVLIVIAVVCVALPSVENAVRWVDENGCGVRCLLSKAEDRVCGSCVRC